MMVVIEPGASLLQSFTVAVGLNVKRGKTGFDVVEVPAGNFIKSKLIFEI
jgi:hypothetical protein